MIIKNLHHLDIPFKGKASICELEDGQCLAVFALFAGFYKNLSAVKDELSNGHISSLEFPESLRPDWMEQTGFIKKTQGGIIFLNTSADSNSEPLLMIKPNEIAFFQQPLDALHNRNRIAVMQL